MTTEVLDRLNAAIQASGERLTEINNRTQKAAMNGTRELPKWAQQYVKRQMRKRDREEKVFATLKLARAEITRLRDYMTYKAEGEDWTSSPPETDAPEQFDPFVESGR